MTPFTLSRASVDDLARIQALAHAIWPECFAELLAPAELMRILDSVYSVQSLRADIEQHGHECWIARVGTSDVGYSAHCCQNDVLWIRSCTLDSFGGAVESGER